MAHSFATLVFALHKAVMKGVGHTLWQDSSFDDPFLARVQVCGSCRCRWPSSHSGIQAGYVGIMSQVNMHLVFQPCFCSCHTLPGRSFSEYQEAAQYLAGPDFPQAILDGLLKRASLPSKCLAIVHLTPYDAHLERVCLKRLGFMFVQLCMFVYRCGWALAS